MRKFATALQAFQKKIVLKITFLTELNLRSVIGRVIGRETDSVTILGIGLNAGRVIDTVTLQVTIGPVTGPEIGPVTDLAIGHRIDLVWNSEINLETDLEKEFEIGLAINLERDLAIDRGRGLVPRPVPIAGTT